MATFDKISNLAAFYDRDAEIQTIYPVVSREGSLALPEYAETVDKVIQGWIPYRPATVSGSSVPVYAYIFSLAMSINNSNDRIEHPHIVFYRNTLGELEAGLACSSARTLLDLSGIPTGSSGSSDTWAHLRDHVDLTGLPPSRARELVEQWNNPTWLIPSTALHTACRATSTHVQSAYTQSCSHLHALMKSLMAYFNVSSFNELITSMCDHVEQEYVRMSTAISETQTAYVDPTEEILARYAFRKSILIEGDQGSGKTVAARAFANQPGMIYLELGGNAGVTDMDLVGYNYPTFNDNKPIWIDGILSQAMRLASKDKKVVLVMDEFLRIPSEYLKVFLNLLSPIETSGGNVFRLNTGRVLSVDETGIGTVEILTAPCENLCIVATTNVGAQFNVEDMDPALRERFVVVRKDTTEPFLRMVCTKLLSQKAFKAEELVDRLVAFFSLMSRAYDDKKLRNKPSTRILADAILFANSEEDVYHHLRVSALQWTANSHNGAPNPDQVEAVYAAVGAAQSTPLVELMQAGTNLV